jgi:antitoxin component of MazEF toxin-antitoxin module
MTTQIVRVGNTLTVEIPEELVAEASLPVGEPMEWVSSGKGSVTLLKPGAPPAEKSIDEMTLEELLEGVADGTSLGEYDWGQPRGAEVW